MVITIDIGNEKESLYKDLENAQSQETREYIIGKIDEICLLLEKAGEKQ